MRVVFAGFVVGPMIGALVAVAPAMAQTGAYVADDEPQTGSIYARLGGGAVFPNRLEQDLSYNPNVTFEIGPSIGLPVTGPSNVETDFGSGASGVFALGFTYPSGTRTELEYRYASPGVDSVTTSGGGFAPEALPASDSVDIHYLMSNFYFDFDTGSWLTPFIGFGVGGAFVQNGVGERDAAFAYQGRAGFAAELGEALSFDVEYVYTRTRDIVFGPDDFDDSTELTRVDGAPFVASAVMASIRKTF